MTATVSVVRAIPATAARPCPSCHGDAATTIHRQRYGLFDDSDLPRETAVVRCDDCATTYARSDATADAYRRHYARHSKYDTAVAASGSGESAADRLRLDETAAFLAVHWSPAASVLDVGAGRGGMLAALQGRGFAALAGIDPSPGCATTLRARGFGGFQGTLEDARWPTDPATFDAVVLSHVLEHVYDVDAAFAAVTGRIASGGGLYVEVPDAARYTTDGFPPFYFFDPEHINHFDADALARLGARHGWSVRAAWPRTIALGADQAYPAIGVLFDRTGPAAAWPLPASVPLERYVDASRAALAASAATGAADALAASRRPVVLWGAGSHAQRLLAQTSLGGCAIDCIIDNDPGKQGRRLQGHPVVARDPGLERARVLGATVAVAIAVDPRLVLDLLAERLPGATVIAL